MRLGSISTTLKVGFVELFSNDFIFFQKQDHSIRVCRKIKEWIQEWDQWTQFPWIQYLWILALWIRYLWIQDQWFQEGWTRWTRESFRNSSNKWVRLGPWAPEAWWAREWAAPWAWTRIKILWVNSKKLLVFMYYLTWNKSSSVILFTFIKSCCHIISVRCLL